MITKKVNRYYCEYCKKSGCSAWHIRKHENRCTMNPKRICGMCAAMEQEQSNLNELMAMLPNVVGADGLFLPDVEEILQEPFQKMYEAAGCPICALAAVRQKGIPMFLVNGFELKAEVQKIWADINEEDMKREWAFMGF